MIDGYAVDSRERVKSVVAFIDGENRRFFFDQKSVVMPAVKGAVEVEVPLRLKVPGKEEVEVFGSFFGEPMVSPLLLE